MILDATQVMSNFSESPLNPLSDFIKVCNGIPFGLFAPINKYQVIGVFRRSVPVSVHHKIPFSSSLPDFVSYAFKFTEKIIGNLAIHNCTKEVKTRLDALHAFPCFFSD